VRKRHKAKAAANYVVLEDVQTKRAREDCVQGMEQRYNYAVPEDAQITPRTEAFAGGMEQRINLQRKECV
jgi:hypothetical protein